MDIKKRAERLFFYEVLLKLTVKADSFYRPA